MAINKNDLLQRVAAGVIYTLIMGVATLVSWWSTLVVIAVTSGICCYEFLRMATNEGFKPYKAIGTTIAVLMPLFRPFRALSSGRRALSDQAQFPVPSKISAQHIRSSCDVRCR